MGLFIKYLIVVITFLSCSQERETDFQALDFVAANYCEAFFKTIEFVNQVHFKKISNQERDQLLGRLVGQALKSELTNTGNQAAIVKDFVAGSCETLYGALKLGNPQADSAASYQWISSALNTYLNYLDPHSYYIARERQENFIKELAGEPPEIKGLVFDYSNAQRLQINIAGQAASQKIDLEKLVALPPFIPLAAVLPESSAAVAGITDDAQLLAVAGESPKLENTAQLLRKLWSDPSILVKLTLADGEREVVLHNQKALNPVVMVNKLYGDLLYLRVAHFNNDARIKQKAGWAVALALKQQLAQQRLRGLLLDLSDNPGGLLQEAVNVAGLFGIPQAEICIKAKSDNNETMKANRIKGQCMRGELEALPDLTGLPLVILSNAGSASAAEALMLLLRQHPRALIVGDRSFSKGSSQNLLRLDTSQTKIGGILAVTTGLFHDRAQHYVQKIGIVPDIALDSRVEPLERLLREVAPSFIYRESDYQTAISPPPSSSFTRGLTDPERQVDLAKLKESLPDDCDDREENCDRRLALEVLKRVSVAP